MENLRQRPQFLALQNIVACNENRWMWRAKLLQ